MAYKEFPEIKVDYPKFYYVQRRGSGCDIHWIKGQLIRLSGENRKIACEIYEDIYLRNFNARRFPQAREEANTFLVKFVNDHGISSKEYAEIKASEATAARVRELVEKCKAAKPVAKTILDIHRESVKNRNRKK